MACIKFYEYESAYDISRGEVWIERLILDEDEGRITRLPVQFRLTREEFYRRMDGGPPPCAPGQKPPVDEYTTALICAAERRWYETDSTYYKVAPAELPGLVDCDIDVPTDMLRLPFESIVITLPEGHAFPRLMDTTSGELRTIMVSRLDPDTVVMLIDTGARGEGGLPMVFWYTLALRGDRTYRRGSRCEYFAWTRRWHSKCPHPRLRPPRRRRGVHGDRCGSPGRGRCPDEGC